MAHDLWIEKLEGIKGVIRSR